MTTRSLILHPHEVRTALADTLGLVVRPVKGLGGIRPENKLGKCPLGVTGDRLCCKETWQEFFDDEIPKDRTRAVRGRMGVPAQPDRLSYVAYRADGEIPLHPEHGKAIWRSPATMPAWASRITLEVVGVRVCRTFDLTGKDAIACGFVPPSEDEQGVRDLARQFKEAWDKQYAKRGLGWDSNTWEWAVGVRMVKRCL